MDKTLNYKIDDMITKIIEKLIETDQGNIKTEFIKEEKSIVRKTAQTGFGYCGY